LDMSLLTELCNTLDRRSLGEISGAVGESETSVSRGMQTAIGTVLGGMAARSGDPGFMGRLFDLLPAGTGDTTWSSLATSAADPGSPLMSIGRRILSSLFGSNETAITHTLGTETGLPSGVSSSLLAMAAPMVMGYFSRRLRGGDGLTMGGLAALLQREIPAIRAALPASLVALLWPRERIEREREPVAAAPMVHRAGAGERTSGRWILPLVLLCLIPALWWLFNHARRPSIGIPNPGGTANRMIPEAPTSNLGLPSPVDLYFDTGSSKLQASSQARLDQFASSIKGNRDVHVMVNGYTDSSGNADANMRLSQSRADAVAADLQNRGIAGDEMTAKGFGEDNPVADNTTVDGRSRNRRVTIEAGR
jgi:outer membrane protein OmpA-like peptidoglycan-associated protein